VVLEHPQLLTDPAVRRRLDQLSVVGDVLAAEELYGDDVASVTGRLPGAVSRVVPSTDEQSVIASAILAEKLALPGVGSAAARVFADKIALRQAAEAAGLANPRWREVVDGPSLPAAVRGLGCAEFVLKPTARSGSQGVLLLDHSDDLAVAWSQCTTARGRHRVEPPPPTRYLVEERVFGPEVSVECLARDGEVLFCNVTRKHVVAGRHPVEIGHVVPADLSGPLVRRLTAAMRRLVAATGYETGVLHGEWILVDGEPVLVECAARIPGDRITTLLSRAYGVPFVAAYAGLLSGASAAPELPVGLPGAPVAAAAVRFVTPAPGIVESVGGTDAAAAVPGVYDVTIDVSAGAPPASPAHAATSRAGRDPPRPGPGTRRNPRP